MDSKFEFGGRKFSVCKVNAFKQFHIVRRIGPILAELLPAIKNAGNFKTTKDVEALSEEQKWDLVAKFAGPVMTGLSKLSDADADLVLMGLLSAVEMQQATGNWSKVVVDSMLMIQDLDLPAMIQLAGRSFMFNLSGFFSVLPQ